MDDQKPPCIPPSSDRDIKVIFSSFMAGVVAAISILALIFKKE